MTFRTVTLKIRFKGFETYTRSKTLRFSSKNRDVVVKAIESLSNEFRNYPKKIRLVGVRLSGLEGVRSKDAAVGTLDSLTKSKG